MRKKITIIALALIVSIAMPLAVSAADTSMFGRVKNVANGVYNISNTSNTTLAELVGTVVAAFISLLGVIFIVLFIYAGYRWMMARGNEQNVTESKNIMQRAVIGLIIVIASYAIWDFIAEYLIRR